MHTVTVVVQFICQLMHAIFKKYTPVCKDATPF